MNSRSGWTGGEAGRRHLGGGVLAATSTQIVILAFGALTSVAIARILGPEGTGAFALAVTLFAIVLLVFGLGLRQGVMVMVGGDRWSVSDVIHELRLPVAALGVGGAALVLGVFALAQDGFLAGLPTGGAVAVAISIPFGLAWQLCWSIALTRERYEAYALLHALPFLLIFLLCVPLALTSDEAGAVIGFGIAQALSGLASIGWTFHHARGEQTIADPAVERPPLGEVFSFGLKAWSSELLQFLNLRFDLFFVAAYATTAAVGVYSVAATVTTLAWVLPQALAMAILPRSAALDAAAQRGELAEAESDRGVARTLRHTILLLPPSGAFVAAVLLVAVPLLYGGEFEQAVEYGFILLPGVLALGIAKVISSVLVGRGYPIYALYNTLLTVPPTILAYVLVIPDSGAAGAAVVSTVSYLATTAISTFFLRRVTRLRYSEVFVPRREDFIAYREVLDLSLEYGRSLPAMVRAWRLQGRTGA